MCLSHSVSIVTKNSKTQICCCSIRKSAISLASNVQESFQLLLVCVRTTTNTTLRALTRCLMQLLDEIGLIYLSMVWKGYLKISLKNACNGSSRKKG